MDPALLNEHGLEHLPKFAISLVIGLLIGTERELSPSAKAGIRTFALVSLFGTLAGLLADSSQSGWIIAIGAALVGAMMIAAYQRDITPGESGSTTVIAVLVTYCLGVMIWYGYGQVAAMLAIVTTILLYFKAELHGVTHGLTRTDLVSIFQFAVLSVIILPVLPDTNYGQFETLNPHQTWLMVVWCRASASPATLHCESLVSVTAPRCSACSAASSPAPRPPWSIPATAALILKSKIAVIVILLANLVVLVRLMLVTAVVAIEVLPSLATVLGTGLAFGLASTFSFWRRREATTGTPMPEFSNPTELRTALSFGALYAIVLLLAAWLSNLAGAGGLYMVALVSGLTDVDAITLSSLRLHELGSLSKPEAVTAIGIALLSNIAFKLGIVFTLGGPALGWPVLRGMLLVVAGIGRGLILV